MLLKISQILQGNTCARVSFLIKFQASAYNFFKKETLVQVFSCKFYDIFKNTFFTEHLWTVVSGCFRLGKYWSINYLKRIILRFELFWCCSFVSACLLIKMFKKLCKSYGIFSFGKWPPTNDVHKDVQKFWAIFPVVADGFWWREGGGVFFLYVHTYEQQISYFHYISSFLTIAWLLLHCFLPATSLVELVLKILLFF